MGHKLWSIYHVWHHLMTFLETFFAQKKKRTVAGNTAGGHINPKRQFRTQDWLLFQVIIAQTFSLLA